MNSKLLYLTLALAVGVSGSAGAEEALTAEAVQTNLNYVWTLVAAFLVFFM